MFVPALTRRWLVGLTVSILAGGCTSGPGPGPAAPASSAGHLPPIMPVLGPIRLNVVYPTPTDQIDARDSTFLLGSVGTGDAGLTINGIPVPVAPNGAWLAWLAIPPDSVLEFTLVARRAADSATLVYPVRRVRRFRPPGLAVWIDSTSFSPAGRVWWPGDEFLPVSARAAEGAEVRIRLPDGTLIPLVPESAPEDVPWGVRAFDHDTANLATPRKAERYLGVIRGRALGEDPGPMLGGPADVRTGDGCCVPAAPTPSSVAALPIVEAIIGSDTARANWPIRLRLLDSLPALVEFNDDTAGKGTGDSLTVGRARPGATYHWFFPTGTRATATGRLGDDLRVRLSRGQEAWVPAADAMPLPPGRPATRATVGSVTLTPRPDRLTLRVPLSQRVPFRVEEESSRLTLRLYGALSDINWTRFGPLDRYVRDLRWLQQGDEVTLTIDLGGPVWGYRTRWSANDLLLELRRPPAVDPSHPLAGRLIVVDPGHPPLGATGPTGLREADANLAVSLMLRDLLTQAGARVLLTRSTNTALDLLPRIKFADSVDAELLVSVHNNALPDGVNPFTNNGTSVYYNHPRSLPLARAVERELVRRLGVRDLGVGRGDLALVRPTWMPAILTEGLFLMIPEQEAALADRRGQWLYAVAVRDGIAAFLRGVALGARDVP
jgi:N-acetylmuramoyl-L-alanine amidase